MHAVSRSDRFSWRDTPLWVWILTILALVNFLTYIIVAGTHGGDAWNGHIQNGKYFVASHGRYTEVSRGFWTYSYYHTIFLWITHFSAMAALAIYYIFAQRRRIV